MLTHPIQQNSHPNLVIKLKFKKLIRMELVAGLSFHKLVKQLFKHFQLSPRSYYRLSFATKFGQQVLIKGKSDFQAFLENVSSNSKLTLQHTEDMSEHFEGETEAMRLSQHKNERLEGEMELLKANISNHIHQTKEKLHQEIMSKLITNFPKQPSLSKSVKSQGSHVHVGFICTHCKGNIVGIRYECAICQVQVCEACEQAKGHKQHPLIKMKRREQIMKKKSNKLAFPPS